MGSGGRGGGGIRANEIDVLRLTAYGLRLTAYGLRQNGQTKRTRPRTVATDAVRLPVIGFQISRPGRPHDNVLHVPPRQISVGFQRQSANSSRQRCRRRRPCKAKEPDSATCHTKPLQNKCVIGPPKCTKCTKSYKQANTMTTCF